MYVNVLWCQKIKSSVKKFYLSGYGWFVIEGAAAQKSASPAEAAVHEAPQRPRCSGSRDWERQHKTWARQLRWDPEEAREAHAAGPVVMEERAPAQLVEAESSLA